ncbi:MAG: NPCBM/NEW2 domain-containing protein [Armatimonadetes bacterium]|nr:NPCBM/NEW2 domain-containing protein [Armatimonadota bacterium]
MTPSRMITGLLLAASLLTAILPARAQVDEDALSATDPGPHAVWLETLDLGQMTADYGHPQAGKSIDGNPLALNGRVYPHGVGTHANSDMAISLHGAATRFEAMVGVDDEKKGHGSVTFTVLVDGRPKVETPVLHGGGAPQVISVDLTGARTMTLRVGDGGDGIDSDHADWAGAQIVLASDASPRPTAAIVPAEPPRLTYPVPDPRPAFHGPRVVGATPGRPFLFLIPATGDGPLTYSARGLPAGLTLDSRTGIISGSLRKAGRSRVQLTVRGPRGTARRDLTILGGDHVLAQTPPMGWNSWNVWAGAVDEGKVRAAADELIATGLARHGFQYVNIDDTWEAGRDAQGRIQTNNKFPDMKALADYIHGQGLKFGIYSSPGPTTCAGFTASYRHEDQDAQSYADWGVDYLKYDWCSYGSVVHGSGVEYFQHPYAVMRASLDKVNRDILYSFCQYGMGDVWKWGAQTGGNTWRTTGDINDSWGSLHGIYESQAGHEVYAGPGHWNDPDMLEVGYVGFGNPHPTHLKPNEQILHISMWCLLSAPLLIGCDMTRLDKFTLALLSNDEALDINQDPLGKPAGRVARDGDADVWARPLFDGTRAVGLTNAGAEPQTITVRWADIGIKGRQPVRDLWLHRDVGDFDGSYSVEVPAHGCVLLKIGKPRS